MPGTNTCLVEYLETIKSDRKVSESILLLIFLRIIYLNNIHLYDRGEQIRDFSIDALIDAICIVINDNKNRCEIFNVEAGKA